MCAGQNPEVPPGGIDGSGMTWPFLKVYRPWKKGDFPIAKAKSTTPPGNLLSETAEWGGVTALGFKAQFQDAGSGAGDELIISTARSAHNN
jgi:hypothetical protein